MYPGLLPLAQVFHTFADFMGMPIVGYVVPQSVYPAPQQSSQRPTVRFIVNNTLGIRLVDALANNFNGLVNAATVPVLTDANGISCRIQWPGYEPWSNGLHVVDNNNQPCTPVRVAYTIARAIQQFFSDNQHIASAEHQTGWSVADISFDSLYLVELRHVAQGSWQPVISRRV